MGQQSLFLPRYHPPRLIAGHHLQGWDDRPLQGLPPFRYALLGGGQLASCALGPLASCSPEERVGMLFWRMHRCARIIFSLSYHLGNWTPQQCINFLVDPLAMSSANAEGRNTPFFHGVRAALPDCQAIGGLQFMALKRELVDSHRMTYRQYHDAIWKTACRLKCCASSPLGLPVKKITRPPGGFTGK